MKALLTINEKIIDVTSSKTVFFPLNYFLNKIVREDTCFVCGAERGSKDFDDEHIIPKWVLRNFNLQERRITLLNKKSFIYSKYKIPCCKDCNKELGQAYEEPLSHKLKLKYNDLEKNVDDNFKKLLFKWMSLIFIKTHLKDKEVRFDEDRRSKSVQNSELYDWGIMHHVHCIARSYYTSAVIEDSVYGSLLIIPMIEKEGEPFDFFDSITGRVIYIRLGDYAIIAVLDDSGICEKVINQDLEKIGKNRLSALQVREIISKLISINLHILNRPEYYSTINKNNEYFIYSKIPKKIYFSNPQKIRKTQGGFLKIFIEKIPTLNFDEEYLDKIKDNKISFIFDQNGNFKNNSN